MKTVMVMTLMGLALVACQQQQQQQQQQTQQQVTEPVKVLPVKK
jgi:uncharacterized protein YcfL